MSFIPIKYDGRKPYTDRTPLRTVWMPGDVKRVMERDAKLLLRFAEFQSADVSEVTDQPGEAESIVAAQAQVEQQEKVAVESMLMLVDTMDKEALEAYAMKYEVSLDKRRALDKLRAEVVSLIEQFGAR